MITHDKVISAGCEKPAPVLDITGISDIGLQQWRKTYAWPIADEEFNALAIEWWTTYLDTIADVSDLSRNVMLADIGLPGFLLQHVHLKTASERLGLKTDVQPLAPQTRAHLFPRWDDLGAAFSQHRSGLIERLNIAVRTGAKNYVLNHHAGVIRRLQSIATPTATWALGSRSELRATYLRTHNRTCHFVTPESFNRVKKQSIPADLERASRHCLKRMENVAKKVFGTCFDVTQPHSAWVRRLADLNCVAHGVATLSTGPKELLVTNLGLPIYRAIALALRSKGASVVGFHHGNDMGNQPKTLSDIVDCLAVDRFVVPSHTCARWREELYQNSPISKHNTVEFQHVECPTYETWRTNASRVPLPSSIKNVMIVGYPPNWIRYPQVSAHWALSQIDVEIELIETLTRSGFRVLYKAHPEWEDFTRKLLDGVSGCEFLGGHLERCWVDADAFVFPRTSSTSFGFALCTNRPIVLLDIADQAWNREAYELLSKRCSMVPSHVDDRLRVRFNKESLLAALRCPVTAPDKTYVTQAMCE